MKILFLYLFFLCFGLVAVAQQPNADLFKKNTLIVKMKNTGDSVLLRWQPSNEMLWRVANQVGYRVERYTVSNDTTAWVKVVFTLRPWTIEDWKTKQPRDTMGAVMATLAFGKRTGKAPNADLGDMLQLKYENENTFFLSMLMASHYPRQAEKMALRFTDKTIQSGKKYLYKIYAPTLSKKLISDTTMVFLDTQQIDETPTMPQIIKEEGDHLVRLKLNKKFCDSRFVGYYYERSEDGTKFKRLNQRPFFQVFSNLPKEDNDFITYSDSLPQNYKKYYYRAIGITYFGELSVPTASVTVQGKDIIAPSEVVNLKAINTQGTEVKISWQKKVIEPDLKGYLVGRSDVLGGTYIPLTEKPLPNGTYSFIDRMANSNGTNYYVVSAIDTAGNAAISLPAYVVMKDEAAPAQPTGLKGNIDSTGIVRVEWVKNTEPDLLGYMVYKANAADHVFTPITPDFLADEYFADSITLRTLSKKVYYRVVAFDKSRRASAYSEILELKKPDRVPPVSPVFNDFSVSDSTATLRWVPSSSEDVKTQILYRKEDLRDPEWREVASLAPTQNQYIDKTVLPRRWYNYTLIAIDDATLSSERSFPLRLRPYDSGIRKGVQNLTATLTPTKQIQLKWSPLRNTSGRVLIYRRINQNSLVLIKNAADNEAVFLDNAPQNGTYQYALKTIYADGGESPLSKLVQLTKQ